jgi:hypothetical protein
LEFAVRRRRLRTTYLLAAIGLLPLEKYSTVEEWIPTTAQTPQPALLFSSTSRIYAVVKREERF